MAETGFRRTVTPDGLRIVSEQIPGVRSACVGICVNAGSMHESDELAGISHMLEHMVFRGTESRSSLAIVQEIEGVGGHINAFTSKEFTCFHAHMLDAHLDLALDILCDLLIHPTLTAEDLEREKLVIGEEIRHYEDSPDELIFDYFTRTLYGEHPLARPIIGSVATISTFDRETLLRYMREHYPLQRTVVAAAGNLNHDRLSSEIQKRLLLGNHAVENSTPPIQHPPPQEMRFPRSVQGAHLCRGVPGLAYSDEKKFAGFVLSNILGGGMSSRLFQRIREQEALAYSVYTFLDSMRDSGVFGVYVGTDPEKVSRVLNLIDEEYRKILTDGIPPDEIHRAKEQLKGNLMLGLESTSARMFRLAKLESYLNEFVTLDETLALIDAVTREDVLELAQELLNPEKQYTAVIEPAKEKAENSFG